MATDNTDMAISPRLIRRRIRSVQNTKKITKAMELVAAAKMRRAVAAALRTRAYANLAWSMIDALRVSGVRESVHPLLRGTAEPIASVGRQLCIVMATHRGLCAAVTRSWVASFSRHRHISSATT